MAGAAHPRACGENHRVPEVDQRRLGSSPRVRGKRPPGGPCVPRARLIPARAGKTPPRTGPGCGSRAHPRACGENLSAFDRSVFASGSSPRVRGKPRVVERLHPGERLIPARAGKTSAPCPRGGRRTAHPRACGENAEELMRRAEAEGSSPRVRGKRAERGRDPVDSRLIPARAGKTRRRGARPPCATAHPRACGETPPSSTSGAMILGSSPRVRGKP